LLQLNNSNGTVLQTLLTLMDNAMFFLRFFMFFLFYLKHVFCCYLLINILTYMLHTCLHWPCVDTQECIVMWLRIEHWAY